MTVPQMMASETRLHGEGDVRKVTVLVGCCNSQVLQHSNVVLKVGGVDRLWDGGKCSFGDRC